MYRTILSRHSARLITSVVRRQPQSYCYKNIYPRTTTGTAQHGFSTCGGGGSSGGGGGSCGSQSPQKERFPMPDRDEELKLASMQSLITEDYKRGDFTKALQGSEELLTQTEKHFGRDHPATASAYNNVGLMQKLLGDFIQARKHYNQAMRIYGKVVGRDHASYAMTLHNLGTLNKSQVHFDTSLKATDRLSLVETALEHFEEAWAIRKAELGPEHPHTIATRSSFGSTLAAQVLFQHRYVESGNNDTTTNTDGTTTTTTKKRQYVALNPEAVTQQGWDASEEHLRQAMQMAVANPRGKSIDNNKNNRNQKGKGKKKQPSTKQGGDNSNNNNNNASIETLSAAAAAQHLAIFLKSRAMTQDPYNSTMMDEAKKLYAEVQQVRSQLLPAQHPDLYSTKYSLAELLEVIGDTEAANVLRQEILDTYDPVEGGKHSNGTISTASLGSFPEPDSSSPSSSVESNSSNNNDDDKTPLVVVEQTSASKL